MSDTRSGHKMYRTSMDYPTVFESDRKVGVTVSETCLKLKTLKELNKITMPLLRCFTSTISSFIFSFGSLSV